MTQLPSKLLAQGAIALMDVEEERGDAMDTISKVGGCFDSGDIRMRLSNKTSRC
ncbi:hypothetical protein H6F74_04595 [Trichocoleus sp. FACHB-90]|uniref:hypothetical protein n=1 Tax=Cyanophyceae TaxID=3028117 RepID=UPI001689DE3B|nr:hypothetical protein [Trichocoleus sp. FACHB-90]MBD1925566.1 hypothetical protein [Trichocoleus sp. FACHB-90]